MNKYKIGEHVFGIEHSLLADAVKSIQGFAPFMVEQNSDNIDFTFIYQEENETQKMSKSLYEFYVNGVNAFFGQTEEDVYLFVMEHENGDRLYLYCSAVAITSSAAVERTVHIQGTLNLQMLRFALWLGFGLMTVSRNTIAIHSSCIVCHGKAILFLGESGTGKSTHTRLWRETIENAVLLNDDSPVLRVETNGVYIYGSAWSGKTPCYKAEKYPLAGIVRLSQAPYNHIKKLSILESYAAIHPSCPPEFAYSEPLYDAISSTISEVLKAVPVYHLACLPNGEAAKMSYKAVFGSGIKV